MREIAKQWGAYVGLIAVFVTATASTTYTLNSRMDSLDSRMAALERRVERVEDKIDELDKKLDRNFDELDKKLDQLLLALASRGVVLPAKMDGKQAEAKR